MTPLTVICQAPLSMGFSRQEYWSGLPFLSRGGLPNPGIELGSPALQASSLPSVPAGKVSKPLKKKGVLMLNWLIFLSGPIYTLINLC